MGHLRRSFTAGQVGDTLGLTEMGAQTAALRWRRKDTLPELLESRGHASPQTTLSAKPAAGQSSPLPTPDPGRGQCRFQHLCPPPATLTATETAGCPASSRLDPN